MMTKELGKKLFQKKSNDVRSSTQENEPHSAELKDAAKHDEDFKANSSEVDQELKQVHLGHRNFLLFLSCPHLCSLMQ